VAVDVGIGNGIETVFIPEDDRGDAVRILAGRLRARLQVLLDGAFRIQPRFSVSEILGQLWVANRRLREMAKEGMAYRLEPSPPVALPEEAVAQVAQEAQDRGEGNDVRPVSNVVMMGMGEPLNNFENVVAAMTVMLDDNAYGLSRRRVTLSTSGVVHQLRKLAARCPVALAVSLHAPTDELRSRIMPINRSYGIATCWPPARNTSRPPRATSSPSSTCCSTA